MIEKTKFGDIEVYLKWINEIDFFKLRTKNVTSCFILPKLKGCTSFVFTKNPRGIDFIGGHLENNETPYETMTREAQEEASISVNSAKFLGAIEVFNPDWKEGDTYPEKGYQLFYVSEDFKMFDFVESHECEYRVILDISEIEDNHHNLLDVHKEILKAIE